MYTSAEQIRRRNSFDITMNDLSFSEKIRQDIVMKNESLNETGRTFELSRAESKKAGKNALIYLIVSMFFILFGAVYEAFSHGVFSFYMIYAFAVPLVGGALPWLIISIKKTMKFPGFAVQAMWNFGLGVLMVGSIMSGVLEIYGTESPLIPVYWIAGALILVGSVISHRLSIKKKSDQDQDQEHYFR